MGNILKKARLPRKLKKALGHLDIRTSDDPLAESEGEPLFVNKGADEVKVSEQKKICIRTKPRGYRGTRWTQRAHSFVLSTLRKAYWKVVTDEMRKTWLSQHVGMLTYKDDKKCIIYGSNAFARNPFHKDGGEIVLTREQQDRLADFIKKK